MAFKNQVNIQQPAMQPSRDQITADFVASGQPIEQPGPNPLAEIAGGVSKAGMGILKGIGDFINTQKETPEGRYLLTNMLAGITVGLGADPQVGANLVQAGQRQYAIGLKEQQQGIALKQKAESEQQKAKKAEQKEKTAQENKLRSEFSKFKTNFQEAQTAQDKVVRSLARQTAAGDVSAVFAYMKVLDPGSVVREGEQATARNAAGVPERIRNAYNRTLTGQSLTPEQRQDFLETSQSLFQAEQDKYIANRKVYEDIATRQKLNVLNVVGEEELQKKPTTPKVYNPQTGEFE